MNLKDIKYIEELFLDIYYKKKEFRDKNLNPQYLIISKNLEKKLIEVTRYNEYLSYQALEKSKDSLSSSSLFSSSFSANGRIFCGLTIIVADIKEDFIIGF